MRYIPPLIDGVAASCLQLRAGPWATVLDGVCAHFPAIAPALWLNRIERGRVLDAQGTPITPETPYCAGARIYYYREVFAEPRIAAEALVLYADAHLLVVDKPHFLPVMPSGQFVTQTVLTRLQHHFGNADLVPLHRIDRETAGLVMFSANRATRAQYHALFHERRISKHYEALAPALPDLEFPMTRRSRLIRGEPFFRMSEVGGEANSETRIEVIARAESIWRYRLEPISGRKHQLRVHMAALGAPILNDPYYPLLREANAEATQRPLQLLAKALTFIDPLSGSVQHFESRLGLA